ncbi:MAG: anthrone oxygenase family protein [Pyrinomonadaceae bacterium]
MASDKIIFILIILAALGSGLIAGVFFAFSTSVMNALGRLRERGAAFLLTGAVLYLIGSGAVTMVLNVPLNNALATATPTDPQSADLWKNYLANWTFWNHVRAAASLGAAAAFTIGLVYIK